MLTTSATYYVTPGGDDSSYRVELTPSPEGWNARVERQGEAWAFPLRRAPGKGRLWVGDRLLEYAWEDGRLVVGGVGHPLHVESEARHRAGRIRAAAPAGPSASEVRAPMPGLIVTVLVEEGRRVEAGAGILVIEAMKMENEVAAPAPGIVRDVGVRPGQAVEKDALICRIVPQESG